MQITGMVIFRDIGAGEYFFDEFPEWTGVGPHVLRKLYFDRNNIELHQKLDELAKTEADVTLSVELNGMDANTAFTLPGVIVKEIIS